MIESPGSDGGAQIVQISLQIHDLRGCGGTRSDFRGRKEIWDRKSIKLGDRLIVLRAWGEMGSDLGAQFIKLGCNFIDLAAWGLTGNDLRAWGIIWTHRLNKLADEFLI